MDKFYLFKILNLNPGPTSFEGYANKYFCLNKTLFLETCLFL